jgi:hypothetical protein
MKWAWAMVCLLSVFLLFPFHAGAVKTLNSDGEIDNTAGIESKELVYRDFEITPDGFIRGFIVNISDHAVKSVKLSMWTANKAETKILWRKALVIDSIPPKGKHEIKEPYSPMPDDPASIVFKFRIAK